MLQNGQSITERVLVETGHPLETRCVLKEYQDNVLWNRSTPQEKFKVLHFGNAVPLSEKFNAAYSGIAVRLNRIHVATLWKRGAP